MNIVPLKDQSRFLAGQSLLLVRILGIPIWVDYSWFLIFVFFTWSLAAGYFPARYGGWPAAQYWALGGAAAVFFFASILLHEIVHSLVAYHFHIPVRGIRLFIFGGVAYLEAEPSSAAADFCIAVAGPLSSLALAGLFKLMGAPCAEFVPLWALFSYLAMINALIALFNLFPAFPLDGGRVLRALLWRAMNDFHQATQTAATIGQVCALYIMLAGLWRAFSGKMGEGMGLIFLGWFLENAALNQAQREALHHLLSGRTVAQAMSRNYAAVSADLPLQRLDEALLLGGGSGRVFIVQQAGAVVGLLEARRLHAVPRARWPTTTPGQVMQPVNLCRPLRPAASLWSALEEMDQSCVDQLLVMEDGQVVGVLTRQAIVSLVQALQEPAS